MRYSASEKYEIIQLVERSDLSVRKTLAHLDIHQSTFYNWLRRYRDEGVDGLENMKAVTDSAWNKIPAAHCTAIIDLALAEPQLSPRELAITYTHDKAYFVSESSVYRLLKAQDLLTSPAYILMQASDKFQQPSVRVKEL
jgi:putative transposase